MLAWSFFTISGELMNAISSMGRFEPRIKVKAGRASAARALLLVAVIRQNGLLCGQVAGSITLLVVLVLFLFFDRHAQTPDSRYRDDRDLTVQFMPVGSLPRGRKASAKPAWQTKVSYSSDGVGASAMTVHVPVLMEGLGRHRGDRETGFASGFASSDCSGRAPIGYTRIFIAYRADRKIGYGNRVRSLRRQHST